MQRIVPSLWFDTQVEEAAKLYTSVFKGGRIGTVLRYDADMAKVSGQPEGSVQAVEFTIDGHKCMGINGGPLFKLTPAISFMVSCATAEEVNELWAGLSPGGKALMDIGEYPFSKRYGWIQDKFGVTWQLMLANEKPAQKIMQSLLFTGKLFGRAAEAMAFYVSLFPDAKVVTKVSAPPGPPYNDENAVMFAQFMLCKQHFAIMDGPGEHAFTFSEAFSLSVDCDTQEEIDRYWNALSADTNFEQCGWLKDKYGVTWQIVPKTLQSMLKDEDPAKAKRVGKAMLEMKKLDLKKLQEAYDG